MLLLINSPTLCPIYILSPYLSETHSLFLNLSPFLSHTAHLHLPSAFHLTSQSLSLLLALYLPLFHCPPFLLPLSFPPIHFMPLPQSNILPVTLLTVSVLFFYPPLHSPSYSWCDSIFPILFSFYSLILSCHTVSPNFFPLTLAVSFSLSPLFLTPSHLVSHLLIFKRFLSFTHTKH
jgi:hypothetical protein